MGANRAIAGNKPIAGRIVLFGETYPAGEVAIKSRMADWPDWPELFSA
ncbi:hypothetical protein [Hydrogenibacillus sp. N12]|nr:hypothetical protein [Hydrogenibacillus sp. N12]QZA32444.1 hypothetical protein K2M58_08990 [Hydrogenibacillus sp. N12]